MSLPKYWIDKHGKVIPIRTMSDEYITNCIAFLKEKADTLHYEGTLLYTMKFADIYHELWPVYTALVKEQDRRAVLTKHFDETLEMLYREGGNLEFVGKWIDDELVWFYVG